MNKNLLDDERINYVYFIRNGNTNIFKVGVSNNPSSRMVALQIGNPNRLSLHHIVSAPSRTFAFACENSLHNLLNLSAIVEDYDKYCGEWFTIKEEYLQIIEKISYTNQLQDWIDSVHQEIALKALDKMPLKK